MWVILLHFRRLAYIFQVVAPFAFRLYEVLLGKSLKPFFFIFSFNIFSEPLAVFVVVTFVTNLESFQLRSKWFQRNKWTLDIRPLELSPSTGILKKCIVQKFILANFEIQINFWTMGCPLIFPKCLLAKSLTGHVTSRFGSPTPSISRRA